MTYNEQYAYFLTRYGDSRLGRYLARHDATLATTTRKAN